MADCDTYHLFRNLVKQLREEAPSPHTQEINALENAINHLYSSKENIQDLNCWQDVHRKIDVLKSLYIDLPQYFSHFD